MGKEIWSVPTWYFFHGLAARIDKDFYKNNYMKIWINVYQNICLNLPCPMCKRHATNYIKKKCIYIFKSGIKKDLACNKFCCWMGEYCKNHQKIMDKRKLKEKEKNNKKNNGDDISKMNVKQLKSFCKSNHIKGYSKLRKAELLELIKTKVPNKSSKQSFDKNKIITI